MDEFGDANLQKAPFWWIAGAPLCRSSRLPEGALVAKHLIAEIDFKALTRRGEFDYLTLDARSGESLFPRDYEGVSGGGIWFSPLVIDEQNNLTIERCRLMGVAYFQKQLIDGHREILAHGPLSIERLWKATQR